MSVRLLPITLSITLCLATAHAQVDSEPAPLELKLQRQLTEQTLERIDAGQIRKAMPAPSPVVPPETIEVRQPGYSTLPALLFAALFLALAAFAAGVISAGRRGRARQEAAAVRLWEQPAAAQPDVVALRDELAAQQSLNETLAAEVETLRRESERVESLRKQRDQAATEVQALRLRNDDTELEAAQRTIDELRAEIELVHGAEVDLDSDRVMDDADEATLQQQLQQSRQHIVELEQVMRAVRDERDAFDHKLKVREQELAELRAALGVREDELGLVVAELQGIRDDAGQQADARSADAEEQREQLADAQQRIGEMRREMAVLRERAAEAERARSRLAVLERELETRSAEEMRLAERASEADQNARRVEALELELASRLEELQSLREEPVPVGAGKPGLEQEYAASQQYARELEEQVSRLQARIGELELAFGNDEDATAQLELAAPGDAAAPTYADVRALKKALDQEEQKSLELEQQLEAARQELASHDDSPDLAELQRNNVKLSAMVVQRDHELSELQAKLADNEDDQPQGEWTSTVSSLENELRRKTSLIDEQADNLREDEQRVSELSRELDHLRDRLVASERESDSLRELLAETKALAASLSGQLHHKEDETIRLRLEREPGDEAALTPTLAPATADIETLRFTLESRRDLAESLETILEEQKKALVAAEKRVDARDDMIVALENEIAANRVTIAAMQNRLSQARDRGAAAIRPGVETQRLEHELQRSVRASEKLRQDLATWRRRVKPLHEGMVMRDGRIRNLEAELALLREAKLQLLAKPAPDRAGNGDDNETDRIRCLDEIERLHDRVCKLETALAETGERLSRSLAMDENHLEQLEDLESARAAQLIRIDELHHELETFGAGQGSSPGDNVVDFPARS